MLGKPSGRALLISGKPSSVPNIKKIMNTTETATELIPKELLFGNPERMAAQISPDGKRLGWIAPKDGVLNIWINDADADITKASAITHDTDRGIRSWFWALDNQHIFYSQDKEGDENWRVYSVNIESGAVTDHTPYENVQAHVAKVSPRFPDILLISMNKENEELKDIYRLTLSTGELEKIASNPGSGIGWLIDEGMNVRGALSANADGGFDLLMWNEESEEWELFIRWDADDASVSGPRGFNLDGTILYAIDSRDANAGRLVAINIATKEIEVLLEDPIYDVAGVVFNRQTHEPDFAVILRERIEWVTLNESLREDIELLTSDAGSDLSILSRTEDGMKWVGYFDSPEAPGRYFLYDRATKQVTHLFNGRPELSNYHLAPMEPFSFEARDGLTIHGYLTFPPATPRSGLPVVLNVHGGPWVRDMWGYSPEDQWLANRGYIAMNVNYRGSTGYGKDFVSAADKEWGGKMHDDLVDAVTWAVEQGYADPERLAIFGGSYGGYASLVGATFTPDLFCCAVAIVGPSNLVSFINTIPPYWRPLLTRMYERVGNPQTEEEFLKSRSPLYKVDNIKIPMLIAHGANDPRVKQAESEQIVAAMEEKGIPYEYLLFPDEGHGFAKPENRMKFYTAAEQFLAEHLGGRSE